MPVTSDSSFAAKLQNAKTILTFIESLGNYQAARSEDSIEEYKKLIITCDTANTNIATHIQGYTMAVNNRSKAFTGKEKTSISKMLSPISKAIAGQYDKTSKEYSSAMSIIDKMRSQSIDKAPADPNEAQKERVSKSELSYGAMLQNFKDLIASIAVFESYTPVNPDITLEKLQAMAIELESLNTTVNTKTALLNDSRGKRIKFFDDLSKRTMRVKSNVSSLYGNDSTEFKQIKGLKV